MINISFSFNDFFSTKKEINVAVTFTKLTNYVFPYDDGKKFILLLFVIRSDYSLNSQHISSQNTMFVDQKESHELSFPLIMSIQTKLKFKNFL